VAPIYVIFSLTAGLLARRQLAAILADDIHQPNFVRLIRYFLHQQLNPNTKPLHMLNNSELPTFYGKVKVYNSAVATFYAPSDPCGVGGMRRQWIRAVPSWRNGPARYDCVFVTTSPDRDDMRGRQEDPRQYPGIQDPKTSLSVRTSICTFCAFLSGMCLGTQIF
jgi:hypothetical protein